MTKTEFYAKIEELIEAAPGSLSGNEQLNELAGWDSLAVLSFIAMSDSTFGVLISANQLTSCETVADLITLFPNQIQL